MLSKLLAKERIPRLPRAAIYILCVIGCYLALGLCLGMLDFDTPTVALALQEDDPADGTAETAAALERRGSVTFRDTPLAEVIYILSEQWNVNIVAGSQVNGVVNGTFRQEKLEKILDSLLAPNNYSYRQIGDSLVVMDRDAVAARHPNFTVEVIDIPAGNAERLEELTEALKLKMSEAGQLLPIQSSGKLAISDAPENIAAVKRLLEEIAGPEASRFTTAPELTPSTQRVNKDPATFSQTSGAIELRPQFVKAKDLEAPLRSLLGEASVSGSTTGVPGQVPTMSSISVIEEENFVVVFGDAEAQHKARLLLQQLDRPRAQVRITGYIYDVDLGEIERLGIDWNAQLMSRAVDANGVPRNLGLSQSGLLVPNAPNNAVGIATGTAQVAGAATGGVAGGAVGTTAAAANGGQFLFRTLNSNVELQALVQALDQTDGSRLLADPHVTVVDRHTASLGIVTEIPIQQLTETQQGGAIGTTTFREAGITLEVTPRIASDGTIEMDVSPEFSVLAGFQNGNPIIDTRRATTTVRVSHGQALVIGGLRSKNTVETVKGIPGLMHARFIGKLFRTHSTEVRESELIVLIMPEIVGYSGGLEREMHALDVTQNQLSRIGTATNSPICPNCNDKHCPNHCPRPRVHNGMQDNGLIGGFDTIFVSPVPPAMLFPDVPVPTATPEFHSPTLAEPYPLTQYPASPQPQQPAYQQGGPEVGSPLSFVGHSKIIAEQLPTQGMAQQQLPTQQLLPSSSYPSQQPVYPNQQPAYQAAQYNHGAAMPSQPLGYAVPGQQYIPTYQAPAYQAPAYQAPAYQAPAYQAPAPQMPEVPASSMFRTASYSEDR